MKKKQTCKGKTSSEDCRFASPSLTNCGDKRLYCNLSNHYPNGRVICPDEGCLPECPLSQVKENRGTITDPEQFQLASETANEFRLVAKICSIQNNLIEWKPCLIIPAIVNAAFSCEVFLKILLNHRREAIEKDESQKREEKTDGHLLKQLFDKLPHCDQEDIIKRMNIDEQRMSCFLKAANNAFRDWRYLFENPNKLISVDLKLLCKLMDVLFEMEKDLL